MKFRCRHFLLKLFCWLIAEILLGLMGLDDLADYSEYLKKQEGMAMLSSG